MQIKQALAKATSQIKKSSASPTLDVELLLAEVLKKDKTLLYSHPEKALTKKQESTYFNLVQRRALHEPVTYLLGYKWFYGYRFKVDSRVLIPRPETEKLVDLALDAAAKSHKSKIIIADICTGSGCVGISIAKRLLESNKKALFTVFISDISPEALQVARINAKKILGPDYTKHLKVVKSDLLAYYIKYKVKTDILTANPPYISSHEYKKLDKQIRDHEPKLALYSGKTDKTVVNKIISQVKSLSSKPKSIFIEKKNGKILAIRPSQPAPP